MVNGTVVPKRIVKIMFKCNRCGGTAMIPRSTSPSNHPAGWAEYITEDGKKTGEWYCPWCRRAMMI